MQGSVRQTSLREHNLALVARSIATADDGGAPSRADLALATGLDRATVGRLVAELIDGGLVAEGAARAGGRAGRPGRPLTPAAGSLGGLGLEINVDYLGARVLDLAGDVAAEAVVERDLRDGDPCTVLADLAELARTMLEATPLRLAGTALAVPGLVDPRTGTLLRAPNLGWEEVAVGADVAQLLPDLPGGAPTVGNEAHLAARAELAARDHAASFLYVSAEIGIGSALVQHGELVTGQHGWGGELGHLAVDPHGRACRCGATGCLETVAGSANLLGAAGLPAATAGLADLAAACEAGAPRAVAAVDAAGRALGDALGSVVNVVDVSVVVLGNALGALTEQLRTPLQATLSRRVLASRWAPPRLEPARVGDRPAMTGAAHAVLARVWADPATWLGP